MDRQAQALQVDRNYDAFVRVLGTLLPEHRDRIALMRDGQIVDLFDSVKDAREAGSRRYSDNIYSLQEVTDEPIDLGFWSHVGG